MAKKNKEYINDSLDTTTWLGEVVSIDDPDRLQRIKVRVFGKFDTMELDDIPWCISSNSQCYGSTSGTVSHNLPKVGNLVEVTFDNGNIYMPKWNSILYPSDELSERLKNMELPDYANANILVYDTVSNVYIYNIPSIGLYIRTSDIENGNVISIDNESNILVRNTNGNEISMRADDIKLTTSDNTVLHLKKDGISLGSIDRSEFSAMMYEEWEKLWKDTIIPQLGNLAGIPTPAGPSGALKTATNWSLITQSILSKLQNVRNKFVSLRN